MTTPDTKRSPRCSPAHGRCPDCKTPLQAWTFGNRWDGACFVELGCAMCEQVKFRQHTNYCGCQDCRNGIDKRHVAEPMVSREGAKGAKV